MKSHPALNSPHAVLDFLRTVVLSGKRTRDKNKILIACSGGPDSVALFHLLRENWGQVLRPVPNCVKGGRPLLGLAHFNHGLRGKAAKRDERFVQNLGKQYRIPVYLGRGDVRKAASQNKFSVEEAARKLRYAFLIQTAKRYGYKTVLLAHTQNDQAETVLMRVIQGTGLRGLCGIRPTLKMEGVLFCRPLLSVKKSELLAYLKKNHFPFCKDASNESLKHLRNRIRLELIPQLEKSFNPRILEALSRIPASVSEEVSALETLQIQAWKKCLIRKSPSKVVLDQGSFKTLPAALQFQILSRALVSVHPKSGLSYDAWKRIQRDLKNKTALRWTLPKNLDLISDSRHLKVSRCPAK